MFFIKPWSRLAPHRVSLQLQPLLGALVVLLVSAVQAGELGGALLQTPTQTPDQQSSQTPTQTPDQHTDSTQTPTQLTDPRSTIFLINLIFIYSLLIKLLHEVQ